MTAQEPPVLSRAAGHIGEIVLNRPARRNALNREMCLHLRRVAEKMAQDSAIRVVIVRAEGPVFCAGADLKERQAMNADEVRARRLQAFAAYDALERLPQPSMAMVHGPVVGAGGEIATACDFIIASEQATFRYPEGVIGTVGATQRLPGIVGLARAKELLFTGRTLTAAEALTWGLVNRVVPSAALDATVQELASQIASAPAPALQQVKRCLVQRSIGDRREALALEMLAIDEQLAGEDWRPGLPGLEALRDKRR